MFYCEYLTLGLPLVFVCFDIIVKLESQRKLIDILWHCWINVLADFVGKIHRDEGEKKSKNKELTDYFIDAYSSSFCFHCFSVNPKGSITICTLLKNPITFSNSHFCHCFEELLPLLSLNQSITLSWVFSPFIWLATNWVLDFSVEDTLVNQISSYMLPIYWLYVPSHSNGTIVTDGVTRCCFSS